MKSLPVACILMLGAFLSPVWPEKPCPGLYDSLSLCTVTINSSKYNGQEIVLEALYDQVDGMVLSAAGCPESKVTMRLAPSWQADAPAQKTLGQLTAKYHGANVIVRGVFHAPAKGCFGKTCTAYEFEAQELLCAEQPKKLGKHRAP